MGNPIVSIEIGCRDKEKTAGFYAGLFDWTTEPQGEHAVRISTGGGEGVDGHVTALGHEPHQYTNFYVRVENIESHCEKARTLGATVEVGPLPLPGGGRFAWLRDPEGSLFSMIEEAG